MDLSNKTVLLVDDEPEIRQLIRDILQDYLEVKVVEADNGEVGVNLLKENNSIDLVVSDLAMPKMNGFEFIRRARQLGFNGTIMVLTGHGDQVVAQQLKGFGVQDFINKPWDNKALVELIKNRLEQAELKSKPG